MRTTTIPRPMSTVKAQASVCLRAVAEATRMSLEETETFLSHPVANVIARLPFIAQCEEADRTSAAHLGIYVMANRGQVRRIFDHTPEDNQAALDRLRLITNFRGGDPEVLEAGMHRLAALSVYGHLKDLAKDATSGEYNPVLEAKWPPNQILAPLLERSRFGSYPELDEVMDERVVEAGWWAYPSLLIL